MDLRVDGGQRIPCRCVACALPLSRQDIPEGGKAFVLPFPPEMEHPGGPELEVPVRADGEAHPGDQGVGIGAAGVDPGHEEVVLERPQETDRFREGDRAGVADPDPDQGLGVRREEEGAVPPRPVPHGEASHLEGRLGPPQAQGRFLDPPRPLAVASGDDLGPRLETQPIVRGRAEEAVHPVSRAVRNRDALRVGGDVPGVRIPQPAADPEIEVPCAFELEKPEHPVDERVPDVPLLPRLEGHFARFEPAGSRHQAGKEPEPLELVDHDVILRFVPEEDLRPRGRGQHRQEEENGTDRAGGNGSRDPRSSQRCASRPNSHQNIVNAKPATRSK